MAVAPSCCARTHTCTWLCLHAYGARERASARARGVPSLCPRSPSDCCRRTYRGGTAVWRRPSAMPHTHLRMCGGMQAAHDTPDAALATHPPPPAPAERRHIGETSADTAVRPPRGAADRARGAPPGRSAALSSRTTRGPRAPPAPADWLAHLLGRLGGRRGCGAPAQSSILNKQRLRGTYSGPGSAILKTETRFLPGLGARPAAQAAPVVGAQSMCRSGSSG